MVQLVSSVTRTHTQTTAVLIEMPGFFLGEYDGWFLSLINWVGVGVGVCVEADPVSSVEIEVPFFFSSSLAFLLLS
jgi:hypothetical protein